MATPYFQQQSAAYNLYQNQTLHVFTPDGQDYMVIAAGKAHAEFVIEVQDHLMHFEVEAMLAQRDSLHDALVRRHVLQQFGAAGDPRFAGADIDSVSAELKRRGISATALKTALRTATSKVNGELKEIWPIRESARSLQYTSYDLVFSREEVAKPAQRSKIWDVVAEWARESRLPGKEGARLATVQEWDDLGDAYGVRVDLHHYPRPDLESCRPITLLDAAERNRDLEALRKSLARLGVELGELSVKPYAVPQTAPLREAEPPAPRPVPPAQPLVETLNGVRHERERLEQQVRLLADALTDSEERLRQSARINLLEQEKSDLDAALRAVSTTLGKLAWNARPADWERLPASDRARHVARAFEQFQASLGDTQTHLAATRDKLSAAAVKLHKSEDEAAALRAQLEEAHLARDRAAEKFAAELQQAQAAIDQWQQRAEGSEATLRAELTKQHNAAMLAQELEFTKQIQEIQQNFMTQIQDMQQDHMKQIQELQANHLKQMQKLRRLAPAHELPPAAEEILRPAAPPFSRGMAEGMAAVLASDSRIEAKVSELGQFQNESQEIFDTRMGEYLRIAKDMGLSEADKWLLAEARKLAEARARQGELGI